MDKERNQEKPQFITQDAFPQGSLGHTFAPIITGRERSWTILSQPTYLTLRKYVNVQTINKLERAGITTLEQLFFLAPPTIEELRLTKRSEEKLRTSVEDFFNQLVISQHQKLTERILLLEESVVLAPEKEHELKEITEEVLDSLPKERREVVELRFGIKDGIAKTIDQVAQQLNLNPFVISVREGKGMRQLRHPPRSKHFKDFFKK